MLLSSFSVECGLNADKCSKYSKHFSQKFESKVGSSKLLLQVSVYVGFSLTKLYN